MEPLFIKNDRILVQKVSYWFGGHPERGDVVVFKDPGGWLSPAEADQRKFQYETQLSRMRIPDRYQTSLQTQQYAPAVFFIDFSGALAESAPERPRHYTVILDRGPDVAIPPESMFLTDYGDAFGGGEPRDAGAVPARDAVLFRGPDHCRGVGLCLVGVSESR